MNYKDRAQLLRHRVRVTLQEAAYLVIERLGGGWDDAVSLLVEGAELKCFPSDVARLPGAWTDDRIAPVDPSKSTILTSDLRVWLDAVAGMPFLNGQRLDERIEAGSLSSDAHRLDAKAVTSRTKAGRVDTEAYQNRHRAVIAYANGAMFNVAELDVWAVSNKLPLSFERMLASADRSGDYAPEHHYVSFEILADTIAWNFVPEHTSPDDARLQLKAAHDTAEPPNPVSRLRDLVMVRYNRQLLCAVYDGDLHLFDTLTYTRLDVTAGRLRYDANPESYLPTANRRLASPEPVAELDARELSLIGLGIEQWNEMTLAQRLSAARSVAATKENSDQVERQADERNARGRYTLNEVAKVIASTGERFDVLVGKLRDAAARGDLHMYGPGQRARYEYTNDRQVRPFYEEAHWDDLNEWLSKNEPRIAYQFPAPDGHAEFAMSSGGTSQIPQPVPSNGSGKPRPGSMDHISLSEALNFIASDIHVPKGRVASEDEPMWRASEAAKTLYQRLHNATSTRPRWVEVDPTIGKPLVSDAAAEEGLTILLHAAGWYDRETTNRYKHSMACVKAGLDPVVIGAAPRDPNDGQWDYGKRWMREYQIGFVRDELSAFMEMPLGAVTHADKEEARRIIEQQYARLDHIAWAIVILSPDVPIQGEARYQQIHHTTQWLEKLGLQFRHGNGLPAGQPRGATVTGMDVREFQYLAVADVRTAAISAKCWPIGADTWHIISWMTPPEGNQATNVVEVSSRPIAPSLLAIAIANALVNIPRELYLSTLNRGESSVVWDIKPLDEGELQQVMDIWGKPLQDKCSPEDFEWFDEKFYAAENKPDWYLHPAFHPSENMEKAQNRYNKVVNDHINQIADMVSKQKLPLVTAEGIATNDISNGYLRARDAKTYLDEWNITYRDAKPPEDDRDVSPANGTAAPVTAVTYAVATTLNTGETTKLKIGANSKEAMHTHIEIRARAMYAKDSTLKKGGIAKAMAEELKAAGYSSERGDFLSAATIEKAIPAGLTGGRAGNGKNRKK